MRTQGITALDGVSVGDDLVQGAWNAVNVCLRVKPEEKVTLITDNASREIGAALHREVLKTGASCSVFLLEDFGPRPHAAMPAEILEDLVARSQVSVFAVRGEPGSS